MPITLNQTQMAKICDVSTRWIRELTKQGTIRRDENGKYSAESIADYIRFLQQAGEDTSGFRDQIAQERYREKKRENDTAERLVAPVELLERGAERGVAAMIPVLELLPSMVQRHLPDVTDDQLAMVQRSVADCRSILADIHVDLDGYFSREPNRGPETDFHDE